MADGSRHLARKSAVQALYQWDLTGQAPDDIESLLVLDHSFSGVDMEYFRHLVKSVPEACSELDQRLAPYVDRDIGRVDPVERAILRIGAWELEFEPTVPVKVVLDEAIELTKLFGAEHGYRFVNGVLDKLAAELRPR